MQPLLHLKIQALHGNKTGFTRFNTMLSKKPQKTGTLRWHDDVFTDFNITLDAAIIEKPCLSKQEVNHFLHNVMMQVLQVTLERETNCKEVRLLRIRPIHFIFPSSQRKSRMTGTKVEQITRKQKCIASGNPLKYLLFHSRKIHWIIEKVFPFYSFILSQAAFMNSESWKG